MTKYNKYPKITKEEKAQSQKSNISKLCCLPILLKDNKNYEGYLESLTKMEDFLPKDKKFEIYQMLYMDKLLKQIEEYNPKIEEQPITFEDILSRFDHNSTAIIRQIEAINAYKKTRDISKIINMFFKMDPMMQMMLSMAKGENMLSSLMPNLLNGFSDSFLK